MPLAQPYPELRALDLLLSVDELGSISAIKTAVISGDGVAVISRLSVCEELQREGVMPAAGHQMQRVHEHRHDECDDEQWQDLAELEPAGVTPVLSADARRVPRRLTMSSER